MLGYRRILLGSALASLLAASAHAADLEISVLDGGLDRPQPLHGAIAALTTSSGNDSVYSDETLASGIATLTSVTAGTRVLRISGPSGFATVEVQVDLAASTSNQLVVLLPHLPEGISDTVTLSGGVVQSDTVIEDALVPNARLHLAASTAVGGAAGNPEVSLYPVARTLSPVAFPAELAPRRLWAIEPAGLTFEGATLRLPNEESLPPGTSSSLWAYSAVDGSWVRVGTATVDSSGDYLESDGAVVSQSGYVALDSCSPLVTAEFTLSLEGPGGTPLSGALVTLMGQPMEESETTGTYASTAHVATGTPVRAFVSAELGDLRLRAFTRPTLAEPFATALNQGEPLRLSLSCQSAQAVSAASYGMTGSGSYLADFVGPVSAAPVTTVTAGSTTYSSASGPLQQAFPNAKPHHPLVEFGLSPAVAGTTTARHIPFTLRVSDADQSTLGDLVEVRFNLDGNETTFPHVATILRGDRAPYRAPEGGSNEYLFVWDRFASFPTGSAGTKTVRLEVTFADEPSGQEVSLVSESFTVEYPTPLKLTRLEPSHLSSLNFTDVEIVVEFDQALDVATVSSTTFSVFKVSPGIGGLPPTLIQQSIEAPTIENESTVRIVGFSDWPADSEIQLEVSGTVAGASGTTLGTASVTSFTTGSNAALADDDGDGLLNLEEEHFGIATGGSSSSDWDGDGLSDYHEIYVSLTDPKNADTDGDSTPDGSDATPLGSPTTEIEIASIASLGTFAVTKVTPAGTYGAKGRAPADTVLSVSFTNPVDLASVSSDNIVLYDDTSSTNVNIAVTLGNTPRTLLVEATGGLTANHTYELYVWTDTDGDAIEDTTGQEVETAQSGVFVVASPGSDEFEATHYLKSLSMVTWETFPLLAPTAGGRAGMALVVPSTRKLLLTETDVSTPGRGLPVSITRVYRSNDEAVSGIFGNNWHFTYDRRFETVDDGNSDGFFELEHVTGDGRKFVYISQSSSGLVSNYASPPGFYDTLKVLTIGSTKHLVQRTKHGLEFFYEFHQSGDTSVEDPDLITDSASYSKGAVAYLVRIRDRNGNEIVIDRHAADDADRPNEIDTITDDLDRVTTFTYSTTTGIKDRVEKVEQFSGAVTRSWLYSYDSNGSLEEVETPPSDWNNEAGALQTDSRKSRTYTYSEEGGVYYLSCLQDGRGNDSLRVFHDDSGDVIQVDYGSGADAGTAYYSYRRTTSPSINRATQIDRNGNVTVIDHDDIPASPYWTIYQATVYSHGLHPTLPDGEPTSYVTTLDHDDDTEVIEAPNTNVLRWIRDDKGNVLQFIRKAATQAELTANGANYKREEDIVWEYAYEPDFNQVIRVTPPRGNNKDFVGSGSIVSVTEDAYNQTLRTFSSAAVDEDKRNAYTRFLYYDHENIGTRLTADETAIGTAAGTVDFDRSFPKSFGRTASDPYRDPPGSVFNDADSDGFADRGGNLFAVREPQPFAVSPSTGALDTNRQVIERHYTYNQYGQPILEIEPDGDRNRSEWFVGAFNLSTNPSRGYLKKRVIATSYTDADLDTDDGTVSSGPSETSLELETVFATNLFGNLTSVTDPRGNTTTITVNDLNLVTKITAADPFGHEQAILFDGNNNVVRTSVQNIVPWDLDNDGIQGSSSEQTQVAAHPEFENNFFYNTANRLSRQELDAYGSDPGTLTTRFEYDAKQQLVATREHEGNVHIVRYDERDLVHERIQGYQDATTSQRTRYDYDHNRNLIQVLDDDGNEDPALEITYDVFDRAIAYVDEIGNRVDLVLDVAGHVRKSTATGQATGAPSELPNTYLSNAMTEYDELGRAFQQSAELWNATETLSSQGLSRMSPPIDLSSERVNAGELVAQTISYSVDGNVMAVRDDNDNDGQLSYDAADRLTTLEDALGNTQTLTYDKNSNVIRVTELEKLSTGGGTDETYYSERFYDELNRLIAEVSNGGNTRRFLWDSRGNLTQVSDAMGLDLGEDLSDLRTSGEHGTFPQISPPMGVTPTPVASINGRGNTTRFTYDGLSRLLETTLDLREDGTGGSHVVSGITTSQTWDGNSRIASRSDPNGNASFYFFDSQNRPVREVFPDGTETRTIYNRVGTVDHQIDARGVAKEFGYDVAERPTSLDVTGLPPGEGQATFAAWRWDGLGRRTRAEDDDSICIAAFDSLSRQVEETQQIATGAPRANANASLNSPVEGTLERVFDGIGRLRQLNYPGGAVIEADYDDVDRLKKITDATSTPKDIATFAHMGAGGRRTTRVYDEANVTQTLSYDVNRRVTRLDAVRTTDNQRIRGFTYAWDRENNRRFERSLTVNTNTSETGGDGRVYRYDSAYRLVQDYFASSANLGSIGNNAVNPTVPTPLASSSTDYHLDQAGNRTQVRANESVSTYLSNVGGTTADAAMNQYSEVVSQLGSTIRAHDRTGNVRVEGEKKRFFDCEGRLVQALDGNDKDVRYRYDADGRRILKSEPGTSSFETIVYFYDGWQCLEEADDSPSGSGNTITDADVVKRYVYGEGIDEILRASLPDAADTNGNSNFDERVDLYFHQNSLGSVVAVTDASGNLEESYTYTAYGEVTIRDENGTVIPDTDVEQPFMFTGRRLDFEEGLGLYYYRLRYYDPAVGRFVSRDPLGMWGDAANVGNAQNYCGNDPINTVDPYGLEGASSKPKQGLFGDFVDVLFTYTPLRVIRDVEVVSAPEPARRRPPKRPPGTPPAPKASAPIPGLGGASSSETALSMFDPYEWDPKHANEARSLFQSITELVIGNLSLPGIGSGLNRISRSIPRANRPPRTPRGMPTRNKGGCFLKGTQVVTPSGSKAIEEIAVGDLVLSRDETTGRKAFKRVVRLFRGATRQVVQLTIQDQGSQRLRFERRHQSDSANGSADPDRREFQQIRCTTEHPFWVLGTGWVAAEDLRPGDRLLGSAGEELTLVEHNVLAESADHYNFEVEDWHTYFVCQAAGASAVWVHNFCQRTTLEYQKGWKKGLVKEVEAKVTKGDLHTGTDPSDAARKFASNTVGTSGDDAGHIIGNLLGGPGGKRSKNIFGQNPHINRGAFAQHESSIRDLVEAGHDVVVKVRLKWGRHKGVPRVTGISYGHSVNGSKFKWKKFANPLP